MLEKYELQPHWKFLKQSKCSKGIERGVGKPLFYGLYPMEIDQEFLVWFVEMIGFHLPISQLALKKLSNRISIVKNCLKLNLNAKMLEQACHNE